MEKTKKINPSLEGNYIEIKRLINSVQGIEGLLEPDEWWEIQDDIFDSGIGFSHSYKGKNEHGFFTMDQRKEFLGKFAAENEQIARDYLHREDSILFYDDIVDYPVYTMKQDNSFEADMIRIFTVMINAQWRRLDRKSKEILGKILMKNVWAKKKQGTFDFWSR